jgi:aspartate kinase
MKFGGSSLKNIKGFLQMVKILQKENTEPIVLVISAFSSATRKLKEAASIAEKTQYTESCAIIDSIINEHYKYCDDLLDNEDHKKNLKELYDKSSKRLKEFLKGISITEDLTLRTLDIVMSFGELFALHTIVAYLIEKGFDVTDIDSTRLICSDKNHGKAKPLIEKSAEKINRELKPLLKDRKIVLTQGFVALSDSGEITTMGMESSNLTAVIIASILGSKQLTFWTNVEGVRTSDPDHGFKTRNIPMLNYDLAYRLSKNGLKLIHSATIDIAREMNIELVYKSCFLPDGEYTVITNEANDITEQIVVVESDVLSCQIPIRNSREEHSAKQYLQKVIMSDQLNPQIFKQSDSINVLFHGSNKRHGFVPDALAHTVTDNLSLISIITQKRKSNNIPYEELINDIQLFKLTKDEIYKEVKILVNKNNLGKVLKNILINFLD